VHFQRDRPFKGMTGINLLFEGSPRWVLAEHLAYELYRWAGVPAPASEHLRLSYDGRLLGYHLLVEQPNKNFLARHQRAEGGNLYKLIWYHQGLVGQHEKKTNLTQGHDDVIEAVKGLERSTGAEQWAFIQKHFNVEEFISYFAVNMCIQNWDGFFNNYFTYHDTQGTGKWEIYPWDEDKTWGDYDGAALPYDWYEMPLTYGMKGDRQPRGGLFAFFGGGPSWWRAGGWFSAPMLANPEFRKRFLARLGELCHQLFTEEKLLPIIDALEKRLAPEIPLRATALGEDAEQALKTFRADIQSFRDQVKHRRKFLLSELARQPR
jgi:spore coat protein CotH